MVKNRYEMDMCTGPLLQKLLVFSLPLMLSSILQLLFNAVDIIVVGQFSGSTALAAVGATTSLIMLITNLFIGISIGANVLAAQFFASGKKDLMQDTVHSAILTGIISGIIMVFVGIFLARPALEAMDTPSDVIDQAVLYMRIYFCGMPFFMTYNYGAAILRAIGDTKRPLYFLIMAGVLNACLNVILVKFFSMGVAGVAIATVISQILSCSLVLYCLVKSDGIYRLDFHKLKIHPHIVKRMLLIGLPAGIQSMLISFSNVIIQSSINSFGYLAMAGNTAAANIDGFIYAALNAITQTCLTFTSQNFGAGEYKRVDSVLVQCVFIDLVIGIIMGVGCYLLGPQLLSIYNNDPEVISYGMIRIATIGLPYAICGIMDLIPGSMRGMGRSAVPMFITLSGVCLFRIFWVYFVFAEHRTMEMLYLSYPVSWILTIVLQLICFYFVRKKMYHRVQTT